MTARVEATPQHGALREHVVDQIRSDIIEGRLAAGTPLRTEDFMERFGVSNSPLREAFAQLAAEGLVEVYRNRGAYVAALTRDSAADLVRVGSLLWSTAVRWSVPRLTPGDVSRLRRAALDFDLSMVSGDVTTALIDAEHADEIVLSQTGSPELARAIAAGLPRLRRLVRLLEPLEHLSARAEMHEGLLASTKRADGEAAARAVERYFTELGDMVERADLAEIAP